jgi:histidyl-tRNA synthetase
MSEYLSTLPYKGTRDFYPEEMAVRTKVFSMLGEVVESFGFQKIDAPMVEPVDIYLAKTSEEIVNQQMYSFVDRGDRKVAIRPEMTPTVARMVAAKIRELPRPIRWYSIPNLWRYEKPGKGRLREHWQLNADIFGTADEKLADVEILQLAVQIFENFGATDKNYHIDVNHRGILNVVLEKVLSIPPDRWANVSRIMDKKEKITAEEYAKMLGDEGLNSDQIGKLEEYMTTGMDFLKTNNIEEEDCVKHMLHVMHMIQQLGHSSLVLYNPGVVRGFDYYTGLVFEIFDNHPDNRRSLAGGGRYNNLASAFTRDPINAIGFGMGDVTFIDFLTLHKLLPEPGKGADVYLAVFPDAGLHSGLFLLCQSLRNAGFKVEISSGHKKLGKQFDEANAKKIPYVILQGETEAAKNSVILKDMENGSQEEMPVDSLVEVLKKKTLI